MHRIIDQETGEIKKCSPSAVNAYWGKMRSILNLMERSEKVDDITIDRVRSELATILDSRILIYPRTLKKLGIEQNQSYSDIKDELGIKKNMLERNTEELKFIEFMKNQADQARKGNWSWRIAEEADRLDKLNWYPFFITLTVDPVSYDPEQLWKEGKAFRKYIRKLADISAAAVGHRPPRKTNKPESDYVRYAAVIEHGKSREHHHCHMIAWLRDIPSSWKQCPNRHIRNPVAKTLNECKEMRILWKYSLPGLSKALYFRTHNDIWHREHHFVLPLKSGKAMKVSTPRVAGVYITKYLKKEHKEWQHRMKATRNLGMEKLRNYLKKMTLGRLEALTWRAENQNINCSLQKTHTVPQGLLRSEARRMHFLKIYNLNQMDIQELLKSNYGIFIKMLRSVRHGRRPDRMHSGDFFDWVNLFLQGQKGYSNERLIREQSLLQRHWPHLAKHQFTKNGALEIGPAYGI